MTQPPPAPDPHRADQADVGPFLVTREEAATPKPQLHEDARLRAVMDVAPTGALAVCAAAVVLLILGWLACVLLFLSRGPVS